MARLTSLFLLALAALTQSSEAQIRVACIGDSITYGARIANREALSFPARLQLRLGEGYEVRNFGLSGRTLRRGADLPFIEEQAFHNALLWQPDLAIILLGTNDTVLSAERPNWIEGHDFRGDVEAIVAPLRRSNPHLRVLLTTSPKIADDLVGLSDAVRDELLLQIPRLAEIRRQLRLIARSNEDFEFVDLWRLLETDHYVDGYHPNPRGADRLAARFTTAILNKLEARGALDAAIEKSLGQAVRGTYRGLRTLSFEQKGHGKAAVILLRPERALAGQPWVYFPGELEPGSEWLLDLAARGFHVAVADPDRPWTTLPAELAARLHRIGLAEGINGRTILEPANPAAITRAALRLIDASSDEAYPTTTALPGVTLDPSADWADGATWLSVSNSLRRVANRSGHLNFLFLGGASVQGLTGHRSRVARPGGSRSFDAFAGDYRAASFGVSGERTEHLLWRVESGTFDGTSPDAIVMQIGRQNLLGPHHSVGETMDGVIRLVSAFKGRYPGARIVLCTPLPAPEQADSYSREVVAAFGRELRRQDFGSTVQLVDVGAAFAHQDGSLRVALSPDGAALTDAGKSAFLEAIGPFLYPVRAPLPGSIAEPTAGSITGTNAEPAPGLSSHSK